MQRLTNPSEIAREALRRLAAERIPPTPDNYRALYQQISGTPRSATDTEATRLLMQLVAGLPRGTEAAVHLAQEAETAHRAGDWPRLGALLGQAIAAGNEQTDWKELIGTLFLHLEAPQEGLTRRRKREMLSRALGSLRPPELLADRLQDLITQWSQQNPLDAAPPVAPQEEELPLPQNSVETEDAGDREVIPDLRELCAFILENPCAAILTHNEKLAGEAQELAHRIRVAPNDGALAKLVPRLRKFAFQMELAGEDRTEIHSGLVHLLQLVVENIGELLIDESWLGGQLNVLKDILARPLDTRGIDNVERRFREVIIRQGQLKASLAETQRSMKTMLAEFVGQLASFARETGAYHVRIDTYADRISRSGSIVELQDVIQEVMRETRAIQLTAQRVQDDILSSRTRVNKAEQRVAALEAELAKASNLVRHDQLTGTLNRHGLEETLEKEISRAQRRKSPLCLAVLDVDNFKQLNDSRGHHAGDQALIHLVGVIRRSLRSQDAVARYGGEEFIIVLPESSLEAAHGALLRMQRELTKHFFLHENQRMLITFSAGVTAIPAGENKESAIRRADALMYEAKQAGKNKVISR